MNWGGGSIQGEYGVLGQLLDSALLCFGHRIQEKTEVFGHRGSHPALSQRARNRLERKGGSVARTERNRRHKVISNRMQGKHIHTMYSMYSVFSPTVVLVEETEEAVGSELKRSRAECARGGWDTAGLSLLSGTHPLPLDTAGLGAGASNRRGEGRLVITVLILTHPFSPQFV